MKYFLISYALLYGGIVEERGRIEFPSWIACQRVKDQLVSKSTEGTYAFECREVKE